MRHDRPTIQAYRFGIGHASEMNGKAELTAAETYDIHVEPEVTGRGYGYLLAASLNCALPREGLPSTRIRTYVNGAVSDPYEE